MDDFGPPCLLACMKAGLVGRAERAIHRSWQKVAEPTCWDSNGSTASIGDGTRGKKGIRATAGDPKSGCLARDGGIVAMGERLLGAAAIESLRPQHSVCAVSNEFSPGRKTRQISAIRPGCAEAGFV